MTDESFEKLKGGCSNCSIHPGSWSGNPHLELEPNRWYGSVWIAERKSIILEVNCAQDIRLWERLYGG